MLWLLWGAALATDLPGPGHGDARLGVWVPPDQTFSSQSLPQVDWIGGFRVGVTERASVAFPAVLRVHAMDSGDGELVVVGGLASVGYGTTAGLSQSWVVGVEGTWDLGWADAVAWADAGLVAVPRLGTAGYDAVSSWSLGVAPVFVVGSRWRFTVPLALTGELGDPQQAVSIGLVDPSTWRWRTPSTFGGVPQPTVAFLVDRRWSLEGYLGSTWRGGVFTQRAFLGVGLHW